MSKRYKRYVKIVAKDTHDVLIDGHYSSFRKMIADLRKKTPVTKNNLVCLHSAWDFCGQIVPTYLPCEGMWVGMV